jgi:DNA-binding beta-propeller fold protein YncE
MKVKVWKLLGLIFIAIFVLSTANTVHAQTTISDGIGVYPSGAAYDSGTNQVYVINPYAGTISVIQDNINNVTQTISGLAFPPFALAYDSGKSEMWVSEYRQGYSGGVEVIPDKSNKPTVTIPLGSGCTGIAYDSGTNEIYVCDAYTMMVSVISDSSNSITRNVTINSYPGSLVYDAAKKEMFVSVTIGVDVSIIPDNSNSVTKTIKVASNPYGSPGALAYDSVKGRIYVTNSSDVSVISDNNNKIGPVIHNVGAAGNLVYDKSDGKIICSSGEVISDSSNTVTATLDVGTNPSGIAYDSGTGEIYVTNSNDPGTVTVTQVSSGIPSTATPVSTSTPKVPEFSSAALVSVASAMVVVALCAVEVTRKKSK